MRYASNALVTDKGAVCDRNGTPCPPELVELLQKAGVDQLAFRGNRFTWEAVRNDAEYILARRNDVTAAGQPSDGIQGQ